MKQTLKNAQMSVMRQQLEPILAQRGKLGYAAARNFRNLTQTLTEYDQFRNELIEKYGEKGENGQITLNVDSQNFEKFANELAPYNEIEHEVKIMTVPYEDVTVSDDLTGMDLLRIDWMLEEKEQEEGGD